MSSMPNVPFMLSDEWEDFHADVEISDACFTNEEMAEARKELLRDIYEGEGEYV